MVALITGASSGIGRDMARYLASLHIDLILVARRKERLEELRKELDVKVEILVLDLLERKNLDKLYNHVKDKKIDIFINNAGFGLFGEFLKTDLERELEMIDLNVVAYHVLTKLFLQKMQKDGGGYILNVCSSAGFLAGPKLATYYATKNYVLKLTMAIYEELRQMKSPVVISALCPGPVNTEFNKVAHGKFTVDGANSFYVAKYAIKKMFQKKLIIVPTLTMKLGLFFLRFLPWKLLLRITYHIQYRKTKQSCFFPVLTFMWYNVFRQVSSMKKISLKLLFLLVLLIPFGVQAEDGIENFFVQATVERNGDVTVE